MFDYQPFLVASNNIGKTPSLSRISKYMSLVILSLANINNDLLTPGLVNIWSTLLSVLELVIILFVKYIYT